jgi:hypothetical protein
METRRIIRHCPAIEWLEIRRPLSGAATLELAGASGSKTGAHSTADHPAASVPILGNARPASTAASSGRPNLSAESVSKKPDSGYLVYRITNPNQYNNKLVPPFSQVLVQTNPPIPGQVYNILYLVVRNGTAKTFDASSGFNVRFPNDPHTYPILTGNEQWAPGQEYVFYVLTHKYYPLPSQVHSGFEFSLAGARSVGIPGPSGIFLRVKYDPATFAKTLNHIVAYGPGAQGGAGIKYGLPDTAIYEFLSAKTNRKDFSGYF